MASEVAQALLRWLVLYVGLLAGFGFVLYVGRSFSGRPLSDRTLLRSASTGAFVVALTVWLVLLLVE